MLKRGALLLSLVLALVGLAPSAAHAQWWGTTSCDVPYDYGWSGFYGSNCRSTYGSGWGYGTGGSSDYVVGGNWWRPTGYSWGYAPAYGLSPATYQLYRCWAMYGC